MAQVAKYLANQGIKYYPIIINKDGTITYSRKKYSQGNGIFDQHKWVTTDSDVEIYEYDEIYGNKINDMNMTYNPEKMVVVCEYTAPNGVKFYGLADIYGTYDSGTGGRNFIWVEASDVSIANVKSP